MRIKKFDAGSKKVAVYCSEKPDCPLIVLNNHSQEATGVIDALTALNCQDCNLISIGNLDWNHDMACWNCPPLFKNDAPITGGAKQYLKLLLEEILPKARSLINGTPAFTAIAGYSLAGLFALYSLYQTDVFERAASVSGSLWFPDFTDYVFNHSMKRKPEKIYISLGDKESHTRQLLMKTVEENTLKIVDYYRSLGIDVQFEMNPGNHFNEPDVRTARGIRALLETSAS